MSDNHLKQVYSLTHSSSDIVVSLEMIAFGILLFITITYVACNIIFSLAGVWPWMH